MLHLPAQIEEQRRLAMLESLGLTGQPRPASLDALASLAASLTGAEIGLVTLMDSEVVWVVGAKGFEAPSLRRWDSFCQHLIEGSDEPFWIPDARDDVRFRANPYVLDAPHVRFYAGVPLSLHGCRVGTLSVLSVQPKRWDAECHDRLRSLAFACEAELCERHRTQAMRQALCASADALIDSDDHGLILSWSEGAEHLFGYTAAEAIGAEITLIIPAEHQQGHRDGMARWRGNGAMRIGRRLELPARRKDGSALDIELWMSVSHDDGRPRIHANIRDISERALQARALEAAKQEAERASQAKTEFLANMGHELRTPLNGVAACAGLLAQADLSAEHAELVHIIERSAHQLNQLITDILDVTRGHDGVLEIRPSAHSLLAVIETAASPRQPEAEEKGVHLEISVAPSADQTVLVDFDRLSQALGILLSNAVKFTDQGHVRLTASASQGRFRFEVEDTGVGFSEDQKALIFERFQQADPTMTRRFGGIGLGLSLCRDIVHAMGGSLDCESVPGEGSRFWIEAALECVSAPTAADAEATAAETDIGCEAPLVGVRVLVVDDNATNRHVAGLILRAFGAETLEAENGRHGLEMCEVERFDLVLMDMMMPIMDGLEATRRLRGGEAGAAAALTPLVMLTANTLPEHVAQALEAGADAHLAKPVTPTTLLQSVMDNLTASSRRAKAA